MESLHPALYKKIKKTNSASAEQMLATVRAEQCRTSEGSLGLRKSVSLKHNTAWLTTPKEREIHIKRVWPARPFGKPKFKDRSSSERENNKIVVKHGVFIPQMQPKLH